ncbi:hypothetical protein B0O99DRAFT_670082 [Bisporella sp. PMI_857]|nr:hypothetical protein B0O99DRAFT_670082 [Bisporella sp. PMI_857]
MSSSATGVNMLPAPTSNTYPAPRLLPILPSDIPTMARIHVEACSPDLFFRLLYPNPTAFQKAVEDILRSQMRSPKIKFIGRKAVNDQGEVMGWVSWLVAPREFKYDSEESLSLYATPSSFTKNDEGQNFPVRDGLASSFYGKQWKVWREWAEGKCHILVNGLFTLPKFQRRGVATALMKWGEEMADREGIVSFLLATPWAHGLYKHIGFKDFDHADLKLGEWALGPEDESYGWGLYRLWFMIRLPQND